MKTTKTLGVTTILLVGFSGPVLAENCDYYRQQAQSTRQAAAQEDAVQVQRKYHQAAAQAYRNAAAQYDAKYQECLSGRSGGGGNISPGNLGGNNDALQNFYNQMNQYQNQEADRQRRQADYENSGRYREQQGENRAESERLRQEQNAEMQEVIQQLDRRARGEAGANNAVDQTVLGKKLTLQDWAAMFKKQGQGSKVPRGTSQQGQTQQTPGSVPLDPDECAVVNFPGKGQPPVCERTMRDARNAPVPKEIEFPGRTQALSPADWSKRFRTAPAAPASTPLSGSTSSDPSRAPIPNDQPSTLSLIPPQTRVNAATKNGLSNPSKIQPNSRGSGDVQDVDTDSTPRQSLTDQVRTGLKDVQDKVENVRNYFSIRGLCQRTRSSVRYGKPYSNLSTVEQRDIDVECAAMQVQNNTTPQERYEYGSDVVESGGRVLEEGARQITNQD